jgi:L-ascorbate metabolism protein UlaG (beta-lactamase superfamily)
MSIEVVWHGHATFTLDIDGTKVVVDPYFAGNNPVAVKHVDEIHADFILQTHGHGDHITDTVPLAKRTGAQVICILEVGNWIHAQGYQNTWPMNIGGGYDFPFGRVKMTPALHSSSLPDGSYGGVAAGFLVWAAGKVIYVAGDTAKYSDMALIGEAGIDLAILPTGDNFTMGPDDALAALDYLKPRVVIPCHYNTWPRIEQDMSAWTRRVAAETDVTPVLLAVEESYKL